MPKEVERPLSNLTQFLARSILPLPLFLPLPLLLLLRRLPPSVLQFS